MAATPSSSPIRFVAYSDYLCPWCYNVSVRLERLERECEDVSVEWRSYLLRPQPGRGRDLERFRAYTQSWLRPAAEPDAGVFRVWEGDAGPPSHSLPPHLVAKAAARVSEEAFRRLHDRLLHAYFAESRDVTDRATLQALWRDAELPPQAFAASEDPAVLDAVLAEHREALELGATGVPAVRLADADTLITGALPFASYLRWVERTRERR